MTKTKSTGAFNRAPVNGNRIRPTFDASDRSRIEEAKNRVPIAGAWIALGCPGTPPKDGGNSRSPFRDGDNPAAFGIKSCGCLWNDRVEGVGGDVVTFIEKVMRCTRGEAIRTLYRIAGMDAPQGRAAPQWPVAPPPAPVAKVAPPPVKKWPLPALRSPTPGELAALCRLRGLGPTWAGLETMVSRGLLFTAPEAYEKDAAGHPRRVPAFIFTDDARRHAMMRRTDGKPWAGIEGAKSKAWVKETGGGHADWPIGAHLLTASHADARLVVMVEGAPDFAAAHCLLWDLFSERPDLTRAVVIVAMYSSGAGIHTEALTLFAGRRVVIVPDCDGINPATGKDPGEDAAQKWAAQLHATGAHVSFFRLQGYLPPGGKDLNDAAAHAFACEPGHDDDATEPHPLTLSTHLFAALTGISK
jgi:hypothetical protein